MSYEQWQRLNPNAPPWIREGNAGALTAGLGRVKDQLVARLRAGVLSRFPREDIAADDALGYIGSERLLPRAFGEGSAAYATRLRQAWDTWGLAGSHGALLHQLEIQGFAPAHIVQDNGWWTKLAKAVPDFTARLATTVDLSVWTLGGGGNTLTAPGNGFAIFDATAGILNDVILVRLRSSGPIGLGVYRLSQVGDSTHPSILTRVTGWSNGDINPQRTSVLVTAGATLAGHQFETLNSFTVGTTAPRFEGGLLSNGVIFGDTNTNLALGRPAWTFDVRTDLWSRFIVLFPGPGPVGALLDAAGQQAMRALVDRWKPAYSAYLGSVQITGGETWGWPPDRTWGSWTWGGDTVIFLGP